MTNYMLGDILGAAQAVLGFSAILLAPGFLLGGVLDLFGFRASSLSARVAFGIALSFGISPISIELACRLLPLPIGAMLFWISLIAMLVWLSVDRRNLRVSSDRYITLLGIFLVLGSLVVVGELVDLQSGSGLYLSVTTLDQAYRVAFTNSIVHTGIPPVNPLYHPGVAAPLRYYYFWYAVCALCMEVAHVTARQALIASSVWAGIGLTAMIALFARYFLAIRDGLHRYILAAALLLTVTGLDILPVLFNLIVHHDFRGDLEWWSTDQIASWLDSILWVPNHLASMLASTGALLLLWRSRQSASFRQRLTAMLLAGAAIASAFGLSVYVAVGFGLLLAGWSVSLLVGQRDVAAVLRNCGAAATAGILLIPFLRDLLGAHSGTQGRGSATPSHMFAMSVREMISADLVADLGFLAGLKQTHPVALIQAARLLLLLPGYILELGLFGLVLVVAVAARKRLDAPRRTAVALAIGGLVIVSFVRSSVIGNNDFGYRAALLPCFFLLLLAADWITSGTEKRAAGLGWTLLAVGLLGTAFQAVMLRVFVPLHVSAQMPGFVGLPSRVYAVRREYDAVGSAIPKRAVVQANLINPGDYFYVANMLYSRNAMASDAGVDCGAVFGGDPSVCLPTQEAIRRIFAVPSMPVSGILAECRRLGIDYLVVNRSDPAWQDKLGWVWVLPYIESGNQGQDIAVRNDDLDFRSIKCGAK